MWGLAAYGCAGEHTIQVASAGLKEGRGDEANKYRLTLCVFFF